MTAVKSWVVFCEGCDQSEASETVPNAHLTLAKVRSGLREMGWHRVGSSYDICPECWDFGVRGPRSFEKTETLSDV